jgi:arsenate reductase
MARTSRGHRSKDIAMTTVLHNKNCSTSRAALDAASAAGIEVEVHDYLKKPLSERELRDLAGKLEDPLTDLVRRDGFFKDQGLTDADVQTEDQVVAVLVEHPRLLQRPVIVKGDRAIIGRPKDRVPAFLAD